ncbi:MAG: helix-turn-helix domain-containing protein [Leptothrix sp. (in: b-proteobacteria)]
MSEPTPTSPTGAESVSSWSGETAGAILRSARQAHGLDLDTLASALKVSTRKLELLEQDQYDGLPGLAFVRSLALSVCRQLQIDAQPVLALLPSVGVAPSALEHVTRGLATPFREPVTRINPDKWPEWLRFSVIAPAVLLLLALAFWLMPTGRSFLGATPWSAAASAASAPETVTIEPPSSVVTPPASLAPAASAVSQAASAVVETVFSAPAEDPSASQPAAPVAAGPVVLRATSESWVEVRDAGGAVLLSRMLLPGEVVGLDGSLPLKLKIGKADGIRVSLRGQPVDLAPYTRDSVARFELK